MKKLIGCLSAAILLATTVSVYSAFAETLELNDGAVTSDKITEVSASLEANADYAILLLDGEEAAYAENTDSISAQFDMPLPIGKHTAEIITVKDESAGRRSISFYVTARLENELMRDDMSTSPQINGGKSAQIQVGNPIATTKTGSDIYIAAAKVNGKADDSAFAFIVPIDRDEGAEAVYPFIYLYNLSWNDEITIETDMFFSHPARLGFETRNNDGKYGFPFGSNGNELFRKDGTIGGTTYSYPIGEWFHMKLVLDCSALKGDIWINDEKVLENCAQGDTVKNIATFKIQPVFEESVAGQMIALDNLVISTGKNIGGFDNISYKDGEEWKAADSENVPADARKILLSGITNIAEGDIRDKVKAYTNGHEMSVVSAAAGSDGSVSVEFAEPIGTQRNVRILVDAQDTLGNFLEYRFTSAMPQVAVKSVDFTLNNQKVLTGYQLREGSFAANGILINNTAQEENVTAILAIYCDNKLIATRAQEVRLPAGTRSKRCKLTIDIPETSGSLSAEYFMINSFAERKPYSKAVVK